MKRTTREDDKRVLEMLELRDRGWSIRQIARHFGVNHGKVAGIFHRIDAEME